MRNFILLLIISTSLFGCLNNDVLDKDLDNTNFKESSFYISGDFDQKFGFTVQNVELKTITGPLGDVLCKPRYTLRLNDDFVARLNQEWSDEVVLSLYKDELVENPDVVLYFDSDYGQSFEFAGKAIDCNATTSDLQARFVLVAPNTGRATASIERKTVTINF